MKNEGALPAQWSIERMDQICSSVRDGTHDTPKPVNEGKPLITSKHIKLGSVDLTDAYLISPADHEAINKRSQVHQWDVLVSMIGTVGEIALVKEPPEYAIKNVGLLKTGCPTLANWVYHYLKSPSGQATIKTYLSGTSQAFISLSSLRRLPVIFPPPAEQQKIAAILTAYDDLIENNRQRIALLEKMAEEIYREWFVRLRFPGHEHTTFKRGIPEGWTESNLASLCDEQRLAVPKQTFDKPIRYVGLEHIPRHRMTLDTFELADAIGSNKFRFAKGDILFGKIRPYLHKVARAGFPGVCSTDAIVLRPKSSDFAEFVLHTVFSNSFVDLATTASKGTKMPRADWDFLSNTPMLIPSATLLGEFSAKVKPLFDLTQKLTTQNESLQQTRDLLLNRLISGKLRVDDLDIQFPPSMREAQDTLTDLARRNPSQGRGDGSRESLHER